MRIGKWVFSSFLIAGLAMVLAAPSANVMVAQDKGGGDVTGPYDYVENWPQPIHNDGWSWGSIPAVFAESPDRVLVYMRGELPALKTEIKQGFYDPLELIRQVLQQSEKKNRWEHFLMIFDRNGKLVDSWEQHKSLVTGAHRVRISPYDPEKHVWLSDGPNVFKFTNDGKKLVMRLEEKDVPGNEKDRFNAADVTFMPNGDFYVFGGSRILKFSKDGKYLTGWGKLGTGPNEFDTIHGLVIDAKRHLYVADRNNSRIQILDENGKFLDQWPNIPHPYFLYMEKDQNLWVGDGWVHKIMKFDLNGKLLYSWGTFGRNPGYLWGPHQFSVDSEGNLYVANAQGNNVSKFRPKKGADHAKLIGPPFVLPGSTQQ